ncbi:MAG TPA: EAL domain-containing protein [bacterium]|nr:EAL domain-containing protein [bacterium]
METNFAVAQEKNPMPEPDLIALLEQKSAAAFYQPIVSVKKKSVVGIEAVGRGIDTGNRRFIEAEELYPLSFEKNKALDLDRLFRLKGLEGYAEIESKLPGLILFLNLESGVLTDEVVGSGHLLKMVRQLGLNPSLITIELSQSVNMDLGSIKRFSQIHRDNGFLIGLEDITANRTCLDQILHISPDVLKIHPNVVDGLSKDPYKREDFKTILSLSRKIGCLVVAHGVENEEDALVALELGADMLQGSYFSKPQRTENSSILGLKARIVFVASRYKRILTDKINKDKDRRTRYLAIVSEIFDSLGGAGDYERKFTEFLTRYPQIECLYLLDQDGVQVSETVFNSRKVSERKKYLFQPAPKMTDHSLKEYYYSLVYNGLERYVTEPYISLASGNLCVTVSGTFKDEKSQKMHVLCMDIDIMRV